MVKIELNAIDSKFDPATKNKTKNKLKIYKIIDIIYDAIERNKKKNSNLYNYLLI